jgi:DNA-directed RNA polymerase subunit RPC12/RpoP
MTITLPTDQDGRMARACPDAGCSPGFFKVKPGTGLTGKQVAAYCPYCRSSADPNDFATYEQLRYAKDIAVREAHKGLDAIVKDAFGIGPSGKRNLGGGLISMEVSYKPGALPHLRRPFEDEVRRDVVCPHCRLDHTVFGLAMWCPDCGHDIFLAHVAAELQVTRVMLGDVPRREELLGKRVASKDVENCLEDAVSIFEASMKAMIRRALREKGQSSEGIEAQLKRIGNSFQSISRTKDQLRELLGLDVGLHPKAGEMEASFEKRHPVTHNLGVVDRKYLERAQAAEREGREVRITNSEIDTLLAQVREALASVHTAIFGPMPPEAHAAC